MQLSPLILVAHCVFISCIYSLLNNPTSFLLPESIYHPEINSIRVRVLGPLGVPFIKARPQPVALSPPSSAIVPPPLLVLYGQDSPSIDAESASILIDHICNGKVNGEGSPVVNTIEPTAAANNVLNTAKSNQVINVIYVILKTERPDCLKATLDLSASASLCSSYLQLITKTCTAAGGLVTSAGCYDWGIKAFTPGQRQKGYWPTP